MSKYNRKVLLLPMLRSLQQYEQLFLYCLDSLYIQSTSEIQSTKERDPAPSSADNTAS
jgi:hypothetical protein